MAIGRNVLLTALCAGVTCSEPAAAHDSSDHSSACPWVGNKHTVTPTVNSPANARSEVVGSEVVLSWTYDAEVESIEIFRADMENDALPADDRRHDFLDTFSMAAPRKYGAPTLDGWNQAFHGWWRIDAGRVKYRDSDVYLEVMSYTYEVQAWSCHAGSERTSIGADVAADDVPGRVTNVVAAPGRVINRVGYAVTISVLWDPADEGALYNVEWREVDSVVEGWDSVSRRGVLWDAGAWTVVGYSATDDPGGTRTRHAGRVDKLRTVENDGSDTWPLCNGAEVCSGNPTDTERLCVMKRPTGATPACTTFRQPGDRQPQRYVVGLGRAVRYVTGPVGNDDAYRIDADPNDGLHGLKLDTRYEIRVQACTANYGSCGPWSIPVRSRTCASASGQSCQ